MIIIRRGRQHRTAIGIADIAPVNPAVHNLILGELPQQLALLADGHHPAIIAAAAILAHKEAICVSVNIIIFINHDMHNARIRTLRSIAADEIGTLVFPSNIACMHIDGIQPALGTHLAHQRQRTIMRQLQRNELANAQRTLPPLLSLIVEQKQLAALRADNPALLLFRIMHHGTRKAHTVIILRLDVAKINAHAIFIITSAKVIPRCPAARNPVQGQPRKQQQHNAKITLPFAHKYNTVQS